MLNTIEIKAGKGLLLEPDNIKNRINKHQCGFVSGVLIVFIYQEQEARLYLHKSGIASYCNKSLAIPDNQQ